MWNMIGPMVLIVGSNVFYNICTKSMPESINTFGALTITYMTGAVLSVLLLISGVGPGNVLSEISKVNWTSFVLALSIVGLEAGYVLLYRAGWKISIGSMTANICLAIMLLIVGVLLYHETITLRQILGMAVCGIGLFLISY